MLDGAEFGNEIVVLVRGYLDREVAPLRAENAELKERLKALEDRPAPEKGEAGERGQDGVTPEPEAVAAALLPIAEELIAVEVAKAVAALPPPEKGEKGEPGKDFDHETLQVAVDAAIAKAIEALPKPKDGEPGKDAAGIVEALKDSGELVLTLQDGRLIRTGIRDGEKGADGHDGFSLDDFDIAPGDDGRTYVLKFQRGELSHEYELTFPVPVYCGVFKEGEEYVSGDMVTWGGSLWHCDQPTKEKPGTDSWTLSVKKGRDGKDAKVG